MSGRLTQRDAYVHTVASNGSALSHMHAMLLMRRMSSRFKTCAPLPSMFERRSSWMHLRRVADMKFFAAVIPAFEEQPPNISMGMHDEAVSLAA
ncbi:hypothetical protein ARMGADRAFT_1077844 [Armillaria gallica]|uniref:Uncharacterized protein n=1 Tax=Armillaria gallica TaxID=47427 RepID=A0A2H3E3E9_ARMGA|nr:hypothetical protein ARMGADRAFT_1077844 [Armillaria gallica]